MATTYQPIATTTLGSTSGTVTFSSIPSTYTDLVAVINCTTTSLVSVTMRLNSDTGSNYSFTRLMGDGASGSSSRQTSQTSLQLNSGNTTVDRDFIILNLQSYSDSTIYKTTLHRNSNPNYVSNFVGLWRSTSAINQIDFLAGATTFTVGSTFTIYGVKAA